MLLSDIEAVIDFHGGVNMERVLATSEEVEQARYNEEEAERENISDTQEGRLNYVTQRNKNQKNKNWSNFGLLMQWDFQTLGGGEPPQFKCKKVRVKQK